MNEMYCVFVEQNWQLNRPWIARTPRYGYGNSHTNTMGTMIFSVFHYPVCLLHNSNFANVVPFCNKLLSIYSPQPLL